MPIKVNCYLTSFNCIISTYPNFASLPSYWYFHTIFQTSRLRIRGTNKSLSHPGCRTPRFSDYLLSQLPSPKCLSEKIDAFIYFFLQQLFIGVLFCARFGAWGSSLLFLHHRAEQYGKKYQSVRRMSLWPSLPVPCHCWSLNAIHLPEIHSSCHRAL